MLSEIKCPVYRRFSNTITKNLSHYVSCGGYEKNGKVDIKWIEKEERKNVSSLLFGLFIE